MLNISNYVFIQNTKFECSLKISGKISFRDISDSFPKLLMSWKREGRNRRGRTKNRQSDNLLERFEMYGLREIQQEDREQWKERTKETIG